MKKLLLMVMGVSLVFVLGCTKSTNKEVKNTKQNVSKVKTLNKHKKKDMKMRPSNPASLSKEMKRGISKDNFSNTAENKGDEKVLKLKKEYENLEEKINYYEKKLQDSTGDDAVKIKKKLDEMYGEKKRLEKEIEETGSMK